MSAEEIYAQAGRPVARTLIRQPGQIRLEAAIYIAIAHHAGRAAWMQGKYKYHGYRWVWLKSAPCRPAWAGGREWWMVPSGIEQRIRTILDAARRQQQRQTGGWDDDDGVQAILRAWLRSGHWRRVITRESRP